MGITIDAEVVEEDIVDLDTSTLTSPNVAQQMVFTDSADDWSVGDVMTDDTDSTIEGTIIAVSGSNPTITVQYYVTGTGGNFSGSSGTLTNDNSGTPGTATAVAPTDVTGDIRLPILKTYASIRTVNIALQSVGAGYSWELIDKDVDIGPRIRIYDETDTLTDATIDATIRGV